MNLEAVLLCMDCKEQLRSVASLEVVKSDFSNNKIIVFFIVNLKEKKNADAPMLTLASLISNSRASFISISAVVRLAPKMIAFSTIKSK